MYSQDYENIEVLVIDAGSSDSTKDIVTVFGSEMAGIAKLRHGHGPKLWSA